MPAEETTLASRMKEARLVTAARLRRTITQEAMAELVAKVMDGQLFQAQWSAYETGKSEPPLAVISATAAVSGLEESYLAFGSVPPSIEDANVVAGVSSQKPKPRPAVPSTTRKKDAR